MGKKSNTAELTLPFLTTSLFTPKLWLAPEHIRFPCVLVGILLIELELLLLVNIINFVDFATLEQVHGLMLFQGTSFEVLIQLLLSLLSQRAKKWNYGNKLQSFISSTPVF